jgi:hypothetical protein
MSGKDNLLRGPSPDPEAAARSKANLKRGQLEHGAYAESRRRPIEDEHRERLAAEFPRAIQMPGGNDLVNSAARRLAMADLMAAWISDVGPIYRRGNSAEVTSPARELRTLIDGHEKAVLALAEMERTSHPAQALADALADGAEAWRRNARRITPLAEVTDDDD